MSRLKCSVVFYSRLRDILPSYKRFLLYICVGLIAGVGALVFYFLCHLCFHFFLDFMAGYRPAAPVSEVPLFKPTSTVFNKWMLLVVPAFGGLVSGLLVYFFAPEAKGHGTDAAIDAYHNKRGYIRARIPYVKMLASAITIGSGGSGGREGPIAQIGAGFGSYLATSLNLSDRERRILLAAGIAAGVGSIFKAPLAGAIFAAEVLYKTTELEAEVLIPSAIASVVSYCVFCFFMGWEPIFLAKDLFFNKIIELLPYTVLMLVVTVTATFYVKSFYYVHDVFDQLAIPAYCKPVIGGALTGCIGFFLPDTLSFGYGFLQHTIDGSVAIPLLLSVGFGKILTTSFSIGSGGSGGVFGPSMVIGGAFGGAVGQFFHLYFPKIVSQPASFVIVGMAGFFSAASKAPLSTIIMVSEMTGSYHLLLPSLMVCSLSFVLSRDVTIFNKQVLSRIDSSAHKGEFFMDVMENIKVSDVFDPLKRFEAVREDMPFKTFCGFFCQSEQHYFPVVDKQGRLCGIFSVNDFRECLFDEELAELVVVKDMAIKDVITTTPSEDINSLLRKFTIKNIDKVPVVDDADNHKLLGMVSRREVIDFYNNAIAELKISTKGQH